MDGTPMIALMEEDVQALVEKYCLCLTVGEIVGVLQIAIMDIYRDSQEEEFF